MAAALMRAGVPFQTAFANILDGPLSDGQRLGLLILIKQQDGWDYDFEHWKWKPPRG